MSEREREERRVERENVCVCVCVLTRVEREGGVRGDCVCIIGVVWKLCSVRWRCCRSDVCVCVRERESCRSNRDCEKERE